MARVKYFDRSGMPIPYETWLAHRKDASYCEVKAYDNQKVRVIVRWLGEVLKPDTFPDYYPIFGIEVWNYDATGVLRKDPVKSDDTFPTEKDAIAAYEEFLLDWTDCTVTEEGEFVEEDNDLAPPPPPNLDAPATDYSSVKGIGDDDVGAW